ncbi:gastrotropin-like [Mytilus californianus]|uniref:gastrotropin-like n=1 Tax=Mytilus californianus TaxID=6549 RepID=UPI0022456399|nr:gastrotropin-like [Mytilus californianus]XP_052065005.1 gastrotropin-like [Mytilus californianus]
MAKFIGKWKGESSAFKNYDNFSKASGMPEEMIEKLRNATIYVEFKQDGDIWTLDFGSTVGPDKSYKFESGEEVTTTDPWGKGLKFTFTIDSDVKITQVEQSESMGWKTFTVTKEIQGDDKFFERLALEDGTEMTCEFTRIS